MLATWPEVEVVGEAVNGAEAVRFVEDCPPAVVLMDLQMPVMNGTEATRRIKERWPGVGIIVVTINAVALDAAMTAGADAFVIKGDAPEGLRTALQSVGTVV